MSLSKDAKLFMELDKEETIKMIRDIGAEKTLDIFINQNPGGHERLVRLKENFKQNREEAINWLNQLADAQDILTTKQDDEKMKDLGYKFRVTLTITADSEQMTIHCYWFSEGQKDQHLRMLKDTPSLYTTLIEVVEL